MSKLDDKLQDINSAIYNDSKFRKKLEKKIESHPDVRLFEIMHGTGSYLIYFKTGAFSNIIGNLFDVECFASPGWESEHEDGIGIEPSLHRAGWNRKEHVGKEAKIFDEIFTRKNAIYMYTEDMVDIISFVDYMNHDLIVPVNRKRIEKIDTVDDYINWYYSKIDDIKKYTGKAIKKAIASMDDEMYASFEKALKKHAHGGELMDADTKFEYSRGGDFREDGLDKEDLEGVVEVIDDVIRDVEIASDTVDQALPENLKPNYEAYGRYGFDQLLGNGNPYDDSLFTLKDRVQEEADDFPDDYAKGGKLEIDKELAQVTLDLLVHQNRPYRQELYMSLYDRDIIKHYYGQKLPRTFPKPTNYQTPSYIFTPLGRKDIYMDDNNLVQGDKTVMIIKPETTWGDVAKVLKLKVNKMDNFVYAKGGNLKNHSKLINNWVMFCFNYPYNFLDAFNDDLNMKKHLLNKFSTLYDRVGADAVMNLFWTQLSVKNQSKLLNWVDKNYKG